MRIVTVLTSLGVGGAEKQALAVAERMAERGHEVALLVLRPRLPEEWPTSLPVVSSRHPQESGRALQRDSGAGGDFLREFRPDVVHSHSFHANMLARLLAIGAPRAVVLSTVHNVYEGGWMRMMAYRLTDGLSQRTVAVSKAARRAFCSAEGGESRQDASWSGSGSTLRSLLPIRHGGARMRAELRAAEGANAEFVWLAAGRIVPAKDLSEPVAGL